MSSPALPLSRESIRAVTCERLRLLALGYKISGVLGALMVSFLLFHVAIFTVISFLPESTWDTKEKKAPQSSIEPSGVDPYPVIKKTEKPPIFIFRIIAGVLFMVILVGWTFGGLTFYAGRCIEMREKRLFVQIMAGWNCIWIPYGTMLGVATFITLSTEDTKEEYRG